MCSGTSDVSSKSLYLHPALWRSPGGEGDCVFPCLRARLFTGSWQPFGKGRGRSRHPGTSGRATQPLARLQRLGLGNHGLRAGALRQTPSPVCDQPRALSPSGRRRPLPESVAGPAGRAGCSRVCVSSRPRSFERAPSTRRRLLPASGQSPDLGPDPGSPGRPALLGLGPDSRAVIVHSYKLGDFVSLFNEVVNVRADFAPRVKVPSALLGI